MGAEFGQVMCCQLVARLFLSSTVTLLVQQLSRSTSSTTHFQAWGLSIRLVAPVRVGRIPV